MREFVDDAGPLSAAEVARRVRWGGRGKSVATVGGVSIVWEFRPPDTMAVAHPARLGLLELIEVLVAPDLPGRAAPREESYTVRVVRMLLPNGGERWWWRCPACDRRCGLLYLKYPRYRLACRRCYGLKYRSQYRCVVPTDPRDWAWWLGTSRHAGILRASRRG